MSKQKWFLLMVVFLLVSLPVQADMTLHEGDGSDDQFVFVVKLSDEEYQSNILVTSTPAPNRETVVQGQKGGFRYFLENTWDMLLGWFGLR